MILTVIHINIPMIVGMIKAKTLHFTLPVSFFIVKIVVEQG